MLSELKIGVESTKTGSSVLWDVKVKVESTKTGSSVLWDRKTRTEEGAETETEIGSSVHTFISPNRTQKRTLYIIVDGVFHNFIENTLN